MVFFRRYILLFIEILVLYTVCIASTLFKTPFFTDSLYIILTFFYFIRGVDDILDYEEDLRNNKAPLSKKVLFPFTFLCLGITIGLICFYQVWYFFILLGIAALFIFIRPVSLFFKLSLLPTTFILFIYYNATFSLWHYIVAGVFFLLSIAYAVYKKTKTIAFYDAYQSIESIGGKAYHLLKSNMPNTPPFFTIPCEFFMDWEKNKEKEELLKLKISSFCKRKQKYAVRSSAIDEDSLHHSFAGIHSTKLNVEAKDVFEAVFEVYRSAFTPLAMDYRKTNGLPIENIKMAVLVQAMVEDPDYAGVIYTINPKTDNPDERMVCVVPGLGEALVSGQADSKDYFISGSHIEGDQSFISSKLLYQLNSMAIQCQNRWNQFLDIEFAVKKNKVYFLQARAIATYADIKPNDRLLLIDNSNLIESYYGTTSVLTRSFAKSIYQGVYTKTLEAGHVRRKIMNSLAPTLKNMLYEFEGKLYYNLNSWYHLTSIFPFQSSTSYMEQMMGVSSENQQYKRVKLNLFDMLKIGVCFVYRLKTMEKASLEFIGKFNRVVLPYYGHALDGTVEELLKLYQQIEEDILSDFATPILNDCGVMFYSGRLVKKIRHHYPNQFNELYAACIQADGEMESALVCEEYEEIIKMIREDSRLYQDFIELTAEELYKKHHRADTELTTKIQAYIQHFGSRVMNELKLETETMIENPVLAYEQIQSGVSIALNPTKEEKSISIPKRLKSLAEKARFYICNRERLRLKRTYIFSVVRNIFLGIGRHWVSEGKIDAVEDIFYLTKEEIFEGREEFKSLIKERKQIEIADEKKPYYHRISFYKDKILPLKNNQTNQALTGISNGNSVVTAKVSIMRDVKDPFTPGNIIVAPRTDPGWISLFPLASGLIVEHGSMLSHSFVVAREMGLPAVVGIPDVMSKLKDGDVVTLDSVLGVVTIEE
ncbi:MAG: hypothetical protein K2K15_06115 [Anaeroplasmataceae bacterium]|nr:hypothetical protein [Anaeroplasmataceae bacterium]